MKQGDNTAIIRSVLGGTEEVVCHSGTHQYSDGGIFGVSACGLAAMNFARVIFEIERQHGRCGRDEELLQAIIAKETVQVSLCFMISPRICLSSHRIEHYRYMCRLEQRLAS